MAVIHAIHAVRITLGRHVIPMDEPQRRRVDTVAHSASVPRTVWKHMTQMTVGVRRAHLDAALDGIRAPGQAGGLDGTGEARPSGARIELVGRHEQRLSRHDVHVDSRLVVVEMLAGSWIFGRALLRDPILLGGKPGDRIGIFPVSLHVLLLGSWAALSAQRPEARA